MNAPGSGDPLAVALLPVLLHKLNNATQLVTGLNAVLAFEDGEGFLAERADDLGKTSRQVEDLGWLLAVLATSSGANLLLERREPRGVAIVLDLVSDALRRSGKTLVIPGPLPRLAPDALDGWQIPWAVGSLLWASASDLTEGAELGFEVTPPGRISARSTPAVRTLAQAIREHLPGASLEVAEDEWRLELPPGWFVFGAGA